MNETIEYVQITLKPWYYYGRSEKVVEITLQVNGQKHTYEKIISPDDFESFFDQVMEIAKDHLKKAIKGEPALNGKTQKETL